MIAAAAVSMALFSGLWPHHAASPKPTPPHTAGHVAGWTYDVWTDSFTGAKSCALHARDRRANVKLSLVGGAALAFQFGHRVETEAAVYRIDHGQPRVSADDQTRLILANVTVPDFSLNQNQADGLVLIPLADLISAQEVDIRPNPRARAVSVSLSGLSAAIAAADAQGCRPTSFAQLAVPE